MQIKNYSGTYLHGIDINNWYPCWNLSLSGRLDSPDFMALCDSGLKEKHVSVNDVSIDFLMTCGLPIGALTPRAGWYVWAAAIIRNGGHVGIGQIDTKWINREDRDSIITIGNVEIEFERVRREMFPASVSRLSCLWVAEDNQIGDAHIRTMLGPNIFILKVKIPAAINVAKVNTLWFDAYRRENKRDFIENYWKSIPEQEDTQTWEYLVDGRIEACDEKDLEYIRQHGAHLNLNKDA